MEDQRLGRLQTVALIFAAIESARTGQIIAVQQYLKSDQQQLT